MLEIVLYTESIQKKPRQGVVAEQMRAPNSSSGVSVQQSVGSSPGHDTCVPEQDT